MVATSLEQVPADKAIFQSSYHNYIKTQAADIFDHLTGEALKPTEPAEDASNGQKRRHTKIVDEFKHKGNKAWKVIYDIVKDTHLNYIIPRFINSENRVKEAWQEILNYYRDLDPAQQKVVYQSQINALSLEMKDTGSLKLDCESTITTLENLIQQLSQLPAPYTTIYTDAELILSLRKILVNTPRFMPIMEKIKPPETYAMYKELIKDEIQQKELNKRLQIKPTSVVDNKAIQAANETTTATALLMKIANGESVDFSTILETEGPDALKALHGLVRNVKDDISQTSRNHFYKSKNTHYNKYNKYSNNDRNQQKHDKVLNRYSNNHNYNYITRKYDNNDR